MILSQVAPILQKYERHLAAWVNFSPNQVACLEDEQVMARNLYSKPSLILWLRSEKAIARLHDGPADGW